MLKCLTTAPLTLEFYCLSTEDTLKPLQMPYFCKYVNFCVKFLKFRCSVFEVAWL